MIFTFSGGDGDDTIISRSGADTMDGGTGDDTASFELVASNGIVLDMANNTVNVGAEQSTLLNFEDIFGSAQADTITGDNGNNAIYGGAGADTLDGGLGNDVLYGGDGDDTNAMFFLSLRPPPRVNCYECNNRCLRTALP